MKARSSPLETYRKKRDPERTPEPFGGRASAGPPVFVVQQHAARRLHYDLRLEMDGVLKSWAVPKGPSVHAEEKRLAVHVEDHPLEYAAFEGLIPEGNYGAGAVIVWDQGTYRVVKEGDPLDHLAKGKLELEFFGYKMRGRWTLVRMSKSEKDWLFLKKVDGAASEDELIDRYPQSVVSGLTIDEIRDVPAKMETIRKALADSGAPRANVSGRGQPFMLATLAEQAFSGKEWIFELKYDGVRVMAERDGERVTLYGRNGQNITARYPELIEPLRTLPAERFVIDGEIAAFDEEGRPSFQRLQARMHLTQPRDVKQAAAAVPVAGIFFDCLAADGYDLRRLPLLRRKNCLRLFVPAIGPVRYGDHVHEDGEAFYEAASSARLEGIVAKKAASPYAGGRSREWIKIKCLRTQLFVIGGYTAPQGSRGHFGALHLGLYDGERLVYVSRVGTGFDERLLKQIGSQLQPIRRQKSPFDAGTPTGRGHSWVDPTLVCEVRYSEWTQDGGIRHPVFMGIKEGARPEDCRFEKPALEPRPEPAKPAEPAESDTPITITNPDKVFWPEERYTKGDLIAYYESVAPLLLPYLEERPLVLTRYPDGITGKSFFQKDAPDFVPAWVRTERIYSKDADRDINYFIVNDPRTLRYVVNLGTIPLHFWSSHLGALERPDWLVLDLDPKSAPFSDVIQVARLLHEMLGEIKLPHYVKTSGATGLHILVPLAARYTYEEARSFARLLAMLGVEAAPEIATLARPIGSRAGKVYIDSGQNGYGRTIVAPFSVRPLRAAPVSCPLEWDEVTPRLDPSRFTIRTVPKRFEKMRDPIVPMLTESIDMVDAVEQLEKMHGIQRAR